MMDAIQYIIMLAIGFSGIVLGYHVGKIDGNPKPYHNAHLKAGEPCEQCGGPCPAGEGFLVWGDRLCRDCYADIW